MNALLAAAVSDAASPGASLSQKTATPPLAELKQASLGYPDHPVLQGVSLQIQPRQIYCLLGVNGCGKTTLLRTLLGLLPPLAGQALLAGQPVRDLSVRTLARQIAYVPQARGTPFAFSALEMVLMGFHSQLHWLANPGAQERRAALQALESLNIAQLASRLFTRLSGGEQQLVLIARALVQLSLAKSSPLLILDEPASSLDFAHQIHLLDTLTRLKQQGTTLIMSTHHPLHARAIADRLLIISEGKLTTGTPQQHLTPKALARLYQLPPDVIARHLSLNPDQSTNIIPAPFSTTPTQEHHHVNR